MPLMKNLIYFILIPIVFISCSKEAEIITSKMPNTYLIQDDFSQLPYWDNENYGEVLNSFVNSCKIKKTQNLYGLLCQKARDTLDPKSFLETNFLPFKIYSKDGEDIGLLTGYYEPELKGSLQQSQTYKYPVYETPSDLIEVDLSSIYPELKTYRLRGRLEGNKVVPYVSREENKGLNSKIICYTNSKIDLFFLEVQGSGRITLDNGDTIFVGYDNQNGYPYKSIGKYLVKIGALTQKEVSLQTIRAWLTANPSRMDEVLNYNDSLVYFKERNQAATGSLGLELTPNRSIAVDRKYIPLGSMVYLHSNIAKNELATTVMAQDTGGAIKGAVRADMFLGFGERAMSIAGELKSPLELWVILPKNIKEEI
jgi:membrane-bound lytic murein transglycosylase A